MANEYYAIIEQKNGLSQYSGRPYTKITMLNLGNRQEYVTYVDTSNHNKENWHYIVNHPTWGFVVGNVKLVTRKGKTVVDADSDPVIVDTDQDANNLLLELKKAWAEADAAESQKSSQGCNNNFNDLFQL